MVEMVSRRRGPHWLESHEKRSPRPQDPVYLPQDGGAVEEVLEGRERHRDVDAFRGQRQGLTAGGQQSSDRPR
jgi:hypothetical protein